MKKTYLSPETSLLLIATTNMIAVSKPEGFNENPDDEKTISPDDMLSRRRNVWDDEEEEDY